jgi:hypothetical protein
VGSDLFVHIKAMISKGHKPSITKMINYPAVSTDKLISRNYELLIAVIDIVICLTGVLLYCSVLCVCLLPGSQGQIITLLKNKDNYRQKQ